MTKHAATHASAAAKQPTSWTLANITGSHNWKAVAQSADGTIIAAADNGGSIWLSKDLGVTWRASGSGSQPWCDVAMSADGSHIIAGFSGNGSPGSAGVSVSTSTGASFSSPMLPYDAKAGMTGACSVAISANGSVMACGDASYAELFLSSAGSFSAVSPPPFGSVLKVALSGDGSLVFVSWTGGNAVEFLDGAN